MTLGKIIGGGLPIGAIAGRREVMEIFAQRDADGWLMPQGGTFSANPLSMVAGLASMQALDRGAFAKLDALGDAVRESLNAVIAKRNVDMSVVRPRVAVSNPAIATYSTHLSRSLRHRRAELALAATLRSTASPRCESSTTWYRCSVHSHGGRRNPSLERRLQRRARGHRPLKEFAHMTEAVCTRHSDRRTAHCATSETSWRGNHFRAEPALGAHSCLRGFGHPSVRVSDGKRRRRDGRWLRAHLRQDWRRHCAERARGDTAGAAACGGDEGECADPGARAGCESRSGRSECVSRARSHRAVCFLYEICATRCRSGARRGIHRRRHRRRDVRQSGARGPHVAGGYAHCECAQSTVLTISRVGTMAAGTARARFGSHRYRCGDDCSRASADHHRRRWRSCRSRSCGARRVCKTTDCRSRTR